MKKSFKRFMAFVMTGVLLASPVSPIVASAAEVTGSETMTAPASGNAVASGEVEDFVKTDVFKVVLPTSADSTFKFVMDPQGLINKTNAAAKTSGDVYASGDTIYFQTASGNYTNTSKAVQVLNRGTVEVDVTVEATLVSGDGITMAASGDYSDATNTTPSLYLALIEVSGNAAVATDVLDSTDGAKLTKTLAAASGDLYEYTYASGNYKYDLKPAVASGDSTIFPHYEFALTGACNPNADWSTLTGAAPSVKVVWTIDEHKSDKAPSVATTATFKKGQALSIPVDLGAGNLAATKATVTASATKASGYTASPGVTYDASSKAVTLGTTAFSAAATGSIRYIQVAFDDDAKTVITITVTVQ